MGAPQCNEFWKARSSHGRKPAFNDPDVLWDACEQWMRWVENNPLMQEKIFHYQGVCTREQVPKLRAMTLDSLYTFLDISKQTWMRMRDKPEFDEVIERVERITRDQKFTGAAADLLNPVIIARDLGLKDSSEISGPEGGPIAVSEVTRTIVDPVGKPAS